MGSVMKHRGWIGVALLLGLATAGAVRVAAQDWPQWRGPNRDGASVSFRAPSSWPEALGSRWKIEVGQGYATPLLVDDRIHLFSRQGEEEVMTALDAASGEVIWRTSYPAPFEMNSSTSRHGPGPKSTPAYAGGRLYSFGMSSIVTAFDASTGQQLWQRPATEAQPDFHTAMSPIVDGSGVIIHTGGPGDTALLALDAATGAVQWRWEGDSPAYGSPVVVDVSGVRQVVTFTHRNLVGVSRATGELLWSRPFTTPSDTSSQTPILYRDTIIQAGRANGITAFRAFQRDGGWVTEDVWQTQEVSVHMTNGVAVDGVLYGLSHLNAGQYFALDLSDGTVLWKSPPRQAENAGMVNAGDTVFALEDDGELLAFEASRDGFSPIRRYEVADSETWTQPTISGNSVYVKDVSHLTLWTLN
jgi:outer membrane protein assembly factor BamB